jgi:hypothetical protein
MTMSIGSSFYLMRRSGFGTKWRKWISTCISTARFSILINSSPYGFFGNSLGLLEGALSHPFSSLIVMEALIRMFFRALTGGCLLGFSSRHP